MATVYQQLERTGSSESDLKPLYSTDTSASKRLRNILGAVFIGAITLALLCTVLVLVVNYTRQKGAASAGGGDGGKVPSVRTECGIVQGVTEATVVDVYKGIPYGIPPVGRDRRWMPPQPLEGDNCWEQPFVANEFSSICCQAGHEEENCEDCLYLNVWAPPGPESKPVMVYIHGGGLISGSGHVAGVMPSAKLALETNMVYVSFNYRLNLFGFLALTELATLPREQGEDAPESAGNYGYMDQVLALKWVQKNIAAFGGDTNKVTIFGADSGATSILALLAAPSAKNLFHRAWMMSTSPKFSATLSEAQQQHSQAFVTRIKSEACPDLSDEALYSCLLSLSPVDLLKAAQLDTWKNLEFWALPLVHEKPQLIAIVDGKFLRDPPHVAWKSSHMNQVPLLVGNTAQEVALYLAPPGVHMWNSTAYERYIQRNFTDLASNVLELYPLSTNCPARCQLSSMITDMRLICGTDEKIKVAAKCSEQPVYRYIITPLDGVLASRGMDTRAFFGTQDSAAGVSISNRQALQKSLRQTIDEFVKTGQLSQWGNFPGYTALLPSNNQSVGAYHAKQCRLWRQNAFFPHYAWIN